MVSEIRDPFDYEQLPQLKLTVIDFNVARSFKSPAPNHNGQNKILLKTNTGNQNYQAPELVRGLAYDEKVDIWGAGCVFFYLLTGRVPFPQRK